MPSAAVVAAFEARLATWSHIGDCPFVDMNVVTAEQTVPKPPFVEMEYPVAIETRMGPGITNVSRENGGVRFVITVATFAPGWKAQVLGWADELRDLFRGKVFDGVETFEASPPLLDDRNRDGNRYRVPFVVTYKFDAIK